MKPAWLLSCVILIAACTRPDPGPVTLRILSFNDFHGNIQSEDPSPGRLPMMVNGQQEMVEAGGAAYLATLIAEQKKGHPNSIVVSAGDLTGASPLASALLKDEPTIKVMNQIGLDLNVVGNHEFDHGVGELRRKIGGDCAFTLACPDDSFKGARFGYLAANVVDERTGEPIFAPYVVRDFDGARVGFIGVVTAETPSIVAAKGIQGLAFKDPLEILNKYAGELTADGVEALVAVLHEGASVPSDIAHDGSTCHGMQGALTEIVAMADPAIDLFITGHTHQAYACRLDGRLVTQTASYGRMLTVTDLTLRGGDVVAAEVKNLPVTRDLTPDPEVAALVAAAEATTAPIRATPVATLPAQVTRTPNLNGESALGDLIADAQLAAGRQMGAQIAFMNPGGIRQDLPSDPAAGLSVSLGDLFAVQPFGNNLVVMDLSGAEIRTLLEQQWVGQPADRKPRILQVSAGFSYCYDDRRAEGDKILPETISLDGAPLQADASYRIVVNSFLADGGDRFAVLKQGRARVQGGGDLDALQEFVRLHQKTLPASPEGRICRKG